MAPYRVEAGSAGSVVITPDGEYLGEHECARRLNELTSLNERLTEVSKAAFKVMRTDKPAGDCVDLVIALAKVPEEYRE